MTLFNQHIAVVASWPKKFGPKILVLVLVSSLAACSSLPGFGFFSKGTVTYSLTPLK